MKFDIFDNGVFQPFEAILACAYIALIVLVIVFIFSFGDLMLLKFPDFKEAINKPAPMWMVVILWFLLICRKAR